LGELLEKNQDVTLFRKFARPVGVLCKCIAVRKVWGVEPTSGIGVLAPGATDVAGFFEDRVVDTRLLQAMCDKDAGHPRTYDRNSKRSSRCDVFRTPIRRFGIVRQIELTANQTGGDAVITTDGKL